MCRFPQPKEWGFFEFVFFHVFIARETKKKTSSNSIKNVLRHGLQSIPRIFLKFLFLSAWLHLDNICILSLYSIVFSRICFAPPHLLWLYTVCQCAGASLDFLTYFSSVFWIWAFWTGRMERDAWSPEWRAALILILHNRLNVLQQCSALEPAAKVKRCLLPMLPIVSHSKTQHCWTKVWILLSPVFERRNKEFGVAKRRPGLGNHCPISAR